jgi:hypothetical protein
MLYFKWADFMNFYADTFSFPKVVTHNFKSAMELSGAIMKTT